MPLAKPEVWIGLVTVEACFGCEVLGRSAGACVNVLVWTANPGGFRAQVESAMTAMNLRIVATEDVEPLIERLKSFRPDEAIMELAQSVTQDHTMRWHTFYCFPPRDDEASDERSTTQ